MASPAGAKAGTFRFNPIEKQLNTIGPRPTRRAGRFAVNPGGAYAIVDDSVEAIVASDNRQPLGRVLRNCLGSVLWLDVRHCLKRCHEQTIVPRQSAVL